jgi:hypothetical protein
MLRARGLASHRTRFLASQAEARCITGRSKSTKSSSSTPAAAPSSALWNHAETYAVGKHQHQRHVALGTGKLAELAHGAVVGKDGGTVVLATVVSEREGGAAAEGGGDGTPFNVEYKEKPAASGRIPRTPNRREMGNNESEILTGRAVDRCLRPLFPPLYASDTQVTTSVQAFDRHTHPEPPVSLAANASSAALHASDVPWLGPLGCVRVCMVNGRFVAEPTREQLRGSPLNMIYAGTADRALMLEVCSDPKDNGNGVCVWGGGCLLAAPPPHPRFLFSSFPHITHIFLFTLLLEFHYHATTPPLPPTITPHHQHHNYHQSPTTTPTTTSEGGCPGSS